MANIYIKPTPAAVTVLSAFASTMTKRYFIDKEGELRDVPYSKAALFNFAVHPVNNLAQVSELIEAVATAPTKNQILIRGQPVSDFAKVNHRTLDNYKEPEAGLHWAMLDFDQIPLPEGLSPTSTEAIKWLIDKLPAPFQNVSYFYQFSSSTGIFRKDGTPRKTGLNVHLFFWFSRPVTGQLLKAYLMDHCIQTDFIYRVRGKANQPRIVYGIDMALFNAVQPHYVAAPIVCEGVIQTLNEKDRQKLVKKGTDSVDLPELPRSLFSRAINGNKRVLTDWKRACGWVPAKALTKSTSGGIGVRTYYREPGTSVVKLGRKLTKLRKETEREDSKGIKSQTAILYFEGESSPGSWFVSSRNPCVARRFGDFAEESLKELSEEAYEYIRDELKWFSDIPMSSLPLTAEGYLPPIASFAKARNSLIIAPTGSGKTTALKGLLRSARHPVVDADRKLTHIEVLC